MLWGSPTGGRGVPSTGLRSQSKASVVLFSFIFSFQSESIVVMPRRPIVLRKKVSYDPRFNDPVVGKFLSILMKDGKRSTVERVCYVGV